MPRFIALLRGVNAGMTMQMPELRAVFEQLGFQNVETVLGTGNVIFMADATNKKVLTERIEQALLSTFGSPIATILYSEVALKKLVATEPFKDMHISLETRPHATFLKHPPKHKLHLPLKVPHKGYTILHMTNDAIYSVVDLSGKTRPDIMVVLERTFGKDITTRSWGTIEKIMKRLG